MNVKPFKMKDRGARNCSFTVNLTDDLHKKIREIARDRDVSKSEVVFQMVQHCVDNLEEESQET